MHIMLDIETLGTQPGSAIISIGACSFDDKGIHDIFYQATRMSSLRHMGVDLDTIVWWMQQSEQARGVFTDPDAIDIDQSLIRFKEWYDEARGTHVWAHGASFDPVLMSGAFLHWGLSTPWTYSNIRDTRTLFALSGVRIEPHGVHHNAKDDAIAQALAVIKSYHVLDKTLD